MTKRLTDQERDRLIIQFIENHPGCSPKEAFEGLKDQMSRQYFFKSLARLKLSKTIRNEFVNNRDRSLHVNENDPIIIITKDLDYFESAYFILLEKVLIEIKKPDPTYNQRRKALEKKYNKTIYFPHEHMLTATLNQFKEMIDAYAFKLAIKWPISISNRKLLQRIQSVTLDRISRMNTKLYDILRKHHIDDYIKSSSWYFVDNIDELLSLLNWEPTEEVKEQTAQQYELYALEKYAADTLKSKAFSYS